VQPNLACSGPGRTGFIDFRVAPAVHASSSRELLGRARAADAGRSAAEGFLVVVREGTDEALIAAVNAAPRAMVFLSVPWSCPERVARADFRKAVARLTEVGLAVEAFSLDEESEVCQRWLASLGLPAPYDGGGIPQGWGAVLWLEFGRVVWWVGRGIDERAVGIIGRSKSLWLARQAEPGAAADRGGIS
jgi:hypothetical protein